MRSQNLLTTCLLLFGIYVLTSDAEPVLVTNSPAPRIAARAAGDNSYCVSITIGTTNMNTAMQNDAVATMLLAYRSSDVAADQMSYFRTNFKTSYSTFNWNIFENCGIYRLYTSYYINLSITVTTSTTTTYQLLVFATKP